MTRYAKMVLRLMSAGMTSSKAVEVVSRTYKISASDLHAELVAHHEG